MNNINEASNAFFTWVSSLPITEQHGFLFVMGIPVVLATGFLVYEVFTKGFNNDSV